MPIRHFAKKWTTYLLRWRHQCKLGHVVGIPRGYSNQFVMLRAISRAKSNVKSSVQSNDQWQKTGMAVWLRRWTQDPLDCDPRGFESHFWYFFIGCPHAISIIIPWKTMCKWGKHPMSICVSKNIYFTWCDIPVSLFPIVSRSVYPSLIGFSRLWLE